MRQLLLLAVIFCLCFACETSNKFDKAVITNQIYLHDKAIVWAHRAGKGVKNFPENALETMQFFADKGIKNFEIDLFQSADNKILLYHDDSLGRTATGIGKLSEKSYEDLLKEDLIDDFGNKTKFKIPSLAAVLTWAKANNAYLMLDFKTKSPDFYQKVINELRQQKMQAQVILISYDSPEAEILHKLAPEMLISVTIRNFRDLDEILDTKIPLEQILAYTGTNLSDEGLYKILNELKIPIILGTTDELDKQAEAEGDDLYQKWAKLGIQIITTNRPLNVKL